MFNIFEEIEICVVKFDIILGDTIIQSQTVQSPSVLIIQQFKGICEQLAGDSRPMKCICSKSEWDNKVQKDLIYSVSFENNSYLNEFNKI